MALFAQTFIRSNFTVSPAIKQAVDVVFEAPEGTSNEELESLLEQAASEQIPHWFQSAEFPVANWGGWSSVLHDGDLRKYDDPLQDVDEDEFSLSAPDETPKVGELGSATDLNGHTSTGRVTQFYRMLTEEDEIAAYGEESVAGIKELEDFLKESLALPTDPAKGPVKLIPCTRDEAQFVSCSGIAGFVAPVSSFFSQRLAKWDKRSIMKDRLDVERQAKQHMRLRIKRVMTIDISRFY